MCKDQLSFYSVDPQVRVLLSEEVRKNCGIVSFCIKGAVEVEQFFAHDSVFHARVTKDANERDAQFVIAGFGYFK